MNNKKKKYVGSFADEKDAAMLYDKVAILTHGLKVGYYLQYKNKQFILFHTCSKVNLQYFIYKILIKNPLYRLKQISPTQNPS